MRTDHVHPTPTLSTIVNTISIQPCRYYSNIFNQYHANSTPTLSTTVYIMSIIFVSFFPDFLAIFALLTIVGNAHRPCKQYPNNITTPSLFSF
ncbi:hypothetical protein K443DRAFT_107470 [Laccaria amethystina LaAM-08-1]|uniref:Uncharacterized protein n=1 Tax=Laccaria amethystina LaAM-08-1 TaxID=1095629 RepID=A0A0C9WKF2_9AGAR|nr:hypothetical protein K443DRAFT_107470 [Laccaria amethystina LaAM-08-1]